MARKALIIGTPGTGKSTSERTLDPTSTFIINVANKSLPFRGWKTNYPAFNKDNPLGNYMVADNPFVIMKTLDYINEKMPHVQTIVVDDYGFTLAFEYMRRCTEKGYTRFSDIGNQAFLLLEKIDKLRDDLTIFMMGHPDIDIDANGQKQTQLKTIGKMLNQNISVEGLFTVVLYTNVEKTGDTMEYSFITQNTGSNTGKSPMGMFPALKIPNDLELVRQAMINYEK